jgi:hypothetical protein
VPANTHTACGGTGPPPGLATLRSSRCSHAGENPVALALGEAVADDDRGQHVELQARQFIQAMDGDLLARAVGIAHHAAQGMRRLVLQHQLQDAIDALLPAGALHVVEHAGQVGLGDVAGALFDPRPRTQQLDSDSVAKSCDSGEPRSDAQALAEVTPGMTLTS